MCMTRVHARPRTRDRGSADGSGAWRGGRQRGGVGVGGRMAIDVDIVGSACDGV